jgi:hypothetical protein
MFAFGGKADIGQRELRIVICEVERTDGLQVASLSASV